MRETVEIMRYPVTLTPAPEGGYMVSFVDIPEALTQGETVAEAMEAAKDALLTAFDFYFEDNELIAKRLDARDRLAVTLTYIAEVGGSPRGYRINR